MQLGNGRGNGIVRLAEFAFLVDYHNLLIIDAHDFNISLYSALNLFEFKVLTVGRSDFFNLSGNGDMVGFVRYQLH